MDVAAALDRVADRRIQRRERLGDLAVVMQQRCLGIDIAGRSHVARDLLRGDILAIELAVFVVEEVHIELILADCPPGPLSRC